MPDTAMKAQTKDVDDHKGEIRDFIQSHLESEYGERGERIGEAPEKSGRGAVDWDVVTSEYPLGDFCNDLESADHYQEVVTSIWRSHLRTLKERKRQDEMDEYERMDPLTLDEMEVGETYVFAPRHNSDKRVRVELLERGRPNSEREYKDEDDPTSVRVRYLDGRREGDEGWRNMDIYPVLDGFEPSDSEPTKFEGLDEKDCRKCGGRGVIQMYKHINGGECYRCGGKGIKREYQ